jgi:hypothetical protein
VIAQRYHTAPPKVRRWLEQAGIPVRPRTTREQRTDLDAARLRELYTDREWTAAEIAAELDTSVQLVLRTLHDHGIPVRHAGARRTRRRSAEPTATRPLADVYADPEITTVLRRHRIPRRPSPGAITDRFPTPATLTASLLRALYEDVGLSARQIELLTGQPHEKILDALHEHGIAVRNHAGFAPWTVRRR